VVSLRGLGVGGIVKRSLGVAGQIAECVLALLLASLAGSGAGLVVGVGGLVDLAAGLALWLGGLTALVWCGHCGLGMLVTAFVQLLGQSRSDLGGLAAYWWLFEI